MKLYSSVKVRSLARTPHFSFSRANREGEYKYSYGARTPPDANGEALTEGKPQLQAVFFAHF